MSAVFVHAGQCGSQLGMHFWNVLTQEVPVEENTAFNSKTGKARCVFVDSEEKVLAPSGKKPPFIEQYVKPENCFTSKSGRGNNWAMGFADKPVKWKGLHEEVMTVVRREAERCDQFGGLVLFNSLAGGTGSGLGSRIMTAYREDFPEDKLLTVSVMPTLIGEVPLQHYNTLLSLNCIQENADGCFLLHNDNAVRVCLEEFGAGYTTSNLNDYFTQGIVNALYPNRRGDLDWSVLNYVTPQHKFLDVHSSCSDASAMSSSWIELLKRACNQYKVEIRPENSTITAKVIMKGADASQSFGEDPRVYNGFMSDVVRPALNSRADYLNTSTLNEAAYSDRKRPKSLTFIGNRCSLLTPVSHTFDSAKLKFEARAYVHWYSRYGCSDSTFQHAFHTVESVLDNYREVVNHAAVSEIQFEVAPPPFEAPVNSRRPTRLARPTPTQRPVPQKRQETASKPEVVKRPESATRTSPNVVTRGTPSVRRASGKPAATSSRIGRVKRGP